MAASPKIDEKKFEQWIGLQLRIGVLLAATIVLAAGIFYLKKYGGTAPDYHVYKSEPAELRQITGVFHSALSGHARGLIALGLLILIATPIARVAFSVVAFALERDWLYVVTTIIVLAVLLYSLTST